MFKDLLKEKVDKKDYRWILNIWDAPEFIEDDEYELAEEFLKSAKVTEVYYDSKGDGNQLTRCFEFDFQDEKLYVQLEGIYSSWSSTYYTDIYFAKPYTYTETRYKRND